MKCSRRHLHGNSPSEISIGTDVLSALLRAFILQLKKSKLYCTFDLWWSVGLWEMVFHKQNPNTELTTTLLTTIERSYSYFLKL